MRVNSMDIEVGSVGFPWTSKQFIKACINGVHRHWSMFLMIFRYYWSTHSWFSMVDGTFNYVFMWPSKVFMWHIEALVYWFFMIIEVSMYVVMFFHPSKVEYDEVKHVFMVFHNIEARFCVCSSHGHHIMYL